MARLDLVLARDVFDPSIEATGTSVPHFGHLIFLIISTTVRHIGSVIILDQFARDDLPFAPLRPNVVANLVPPDNNYAVLECAFPNLSFHRLAFRFALRLANRSLRLVSALASARARASIQNSRSNVTE